MRAGRKILLLQFCVFILLQLFYAASVHAQGGDRSSSPGIPGQKPLSFISISLADGGKVQGAADIPAEPEFKLEFDKNVVNSTVWENNRKCFSLISQDNVNFPVSVTKVDDTIDFSQRNNVFVRPAGPLSPGTTYYLNISPDLCAKNGVSTLGGTTSDQGVTISFKTKGDPVTQSSTQPVQSGGQNNRPQQLAVENGQSSSITADPGGQDNKPSEVAAAGRQQAEPDTGGESATHSTPLQEPVGPEHPGSTGKKLNYTSLMTVLALILIIGWIAVELILKRRKGR